MLIMTCLTSDKDINSTQSIVLSDKELSLCLNHEDLKKHASNKYLKMTTINYIRKILKF